ncbi:MAG TPA: immunoglobulin domain-containing protein, partial [Verrucomicrobiae bacterium]
MKFRIESLFATVTGCVRNHVFLLLAAAALVAPDADASTIIRWGRNGFNTTYMPAGLTNAVQLAATFERVVSLQANGTVLDWGSILSSEAAAVTDAKAVAVGAHHALLLRSNGLVVAWGTGTNGENTVPAGLNNVVGIAAGERHNLAVKSDGTVVAWGGNNYGQIDVPPGLSNVVAVDANGDSNNDPQFSVALKSDGTVVVWGLTNYNFWGITTVPAGLSNVVAISAAGNHILALKADGTLVGWGDPTSQAAFPPAGLSNVVSISAGRYANLLLKNDAQCAVWGKIGDAYGVDAPPVGLSNVIAIACGRDFGLALVEATPPVILNQPQGQPVYASNEDGFQLRVSAQGPPPLTYQWYRDGTPLAGKTNDVLWIASVQAPEAGSYTVVISNPFGSLTSNPAIIEVRPILIITLHPQSQTVTAGQNVNLLVHAKGWEPIRYQWQKDKANLPGATNAALTLSNVTASA